MRNAWPTTAAVLSLAVMIAVGCSSTQPDHVDSRTASLFVTTTAKVSVYECYDVWQDTNNPPDGIADVDTGFKTCEPAPPPDSGTVVKAQRNVPWRFSLSISIIRAGTTNEVIATSLTGITGSSIETGDSIPDFVSMTDYDLQAPNAVDKPHQDDLYFLNGKEVSEGSPIYLAFLGLDRGAPNVLTMAPTFDLQVSTGDTVVVRARKQALADADAFISFDQDPEIQLSAEFSVGGIGVVTNGSSGSATDDKAGFSFSYTVP